MSRLTLLFLFVALSALKLVADDETRGIRGYANQLTTGSSLQAQDDKWTGSTGWINGFVNTANKGVVELGLDEDKHLFSMDKSTCVKFDVAVTDANLNTTVYLNQQLNITYNPYEQTKYTDKAQLVFANAYKIVVSNISFKSCSAVTACSACATTYTGSDTYLQVEIATSRTYTNLTYINSIPASDITSTLNTITKELEIDWNYFNGAEEYELEYSYVDNYSSTLGSAISPTLIPYDLDHDATRISTTGNSYRIPLVYESGWIVYRIRPIGRNATNDRIQCAWTGAASSGTVSAVTGGFAVAITTLDNDALNWQSAKTFAENGKTGTGISYSDALGYKRQSLARLNTDQKTIAQSTLYDFYGRPGITILPSPVTGLNLDFRFGLNKYRYLTGTVTAVANFERREFDSTFASSPYSVHGFSMDVTSSSGAANYYSPSNPNLEGYQGYVPDAKGIPYTETKYKPDALGRVTVQTLPGNTFEMGNGKEIYYYYSKPAQVELDNLFGSEAPRAASSFKNYSIDPNQQMSATYLDQYGRTIATAIVGTPPSNVDPLPNQPSSPTNTDRLDAEPVNHRDTANKCIEMNTTVFVAELSTSQGFLYQTTLGQFSSSCTPSMCFDCVYDLQINIMDDAGQELFVPTMTATPGYTATIGHTPPYGTVTCTSPVTLQVAGSALNTPIQIAFPRIGTYTIRKKICVSNTPMADYSTAFVNNQTCTPPCYYVDSLLAAADFTGCAVQTCAQCQANITNYLAIANSSSYTSMFNDKGQLTNTTYTGPLYPLPSADQLSSWYQSCAALCQPTTVCQKYQAAMLADFYPGTGQYADTNQTGSRWTGSIMNPTNTVFSSYSYTSPTNYQNANGMPDGVQLYPGPVTLPQNLTEAQFMTYFKKSWATSFLSKHPENCKLFFYCNVIGQSLEFDERLKNTVHYDTTCASSGLILPFGSLPTSTVAIPASTCATVTDPILISLSGNTLVTAFKNELLNNVYGSGQSIYNFVAVYCNTTVPNGYKFGQDECNRDLMWDMFKSIYLAKKSALYDALYTLYTSNPSGMGYTGGVCPVSTPSVYTSHFPSWGDTLNKFIPGSPSTMSLVTSMIATNNSAAGYSLQASLNAANSATMSANSLSTCASYTVLWNNELNTGCPAYSTASLTVKNNILAAFQGVCQKGCDMNNPVGASSTPSGTSYTIMPGSYTVSSFQGVLDHYLGANVCSAGLILLPAPYPYNVTSTTSPANSNALSSCHCDQVLQVSASFQSSLSLGTLPAGITQEWQLFRRTYGFDLAEYYTLKCYCNKAIAADPTHSWSPGHTWTAPQTNTLATYPLKVNPNFRCQTCIVCSDVVTAIATLTLPSVNSYTTIIDKIKNDSTNSYYTLAILNKQFGPHALNFYLDLYSDCKTFSSTASDTTKTFSYNISGQALDLFTYLNELVQYQNLLPSTRAMGLCKDDKYYLSSLYGGALPTLNPTTYTSAVSGSTLTFGIKDLALSTQINIKLNLPTTYTGTWSNLLYLSNFLAYCPTPTAGANYGFKVDATDNFFAIVTLTGSISNGAFPICQLSSGASPVPEACTAPPPKAKNTCALTILNNIVSQGNLQFSQQAQNLASTFQDAYKKSCFQSLSEVFYRTYKFTKEYDYTLYYYDEAGNLQRTVSPAGVVPLGLTTDLPATPLTYPVHSSSANGVNKQFVRDYRYNSYNQPVKEITVDGGEIDYIYDAVGRVIVSQNAKQAAAGQVYSYTSYDFMGRIGTVGQMTCSANLFTTTVGNTMSMATYSAMASATVGQVTSTYYDSYTTVPTSTTAALYFALNGNALQNLRNRVACITFAENPASGYDHASYFSYDDHGNVAFLVQENNLLPNQLVGPSTSYNMQFKRMDYQYDLISGNMKVAIYQGGQADQFMHQYYYDDDNRLHEVYTSKDNLSWDRDAKYFYYEHGPLARIERADKQVQGADYYYTIHGWLKGVNSDIMQPNNDVGKDGANSNAYSSNYSKIHAFFAKDAMSFALNYYNNTAVSATYVDYAALKNTSFTSTGNNRNPSSSLVNLFTSNPYLYLDNSGAGDGPSLFNGNISSMVTSYMDKDATNTITDNTPFPQLSVYRYDQLHRLKAMKTFHSLSGNTWNAPTSGTTTTYDDSYRTNLTYDYNGNILTLFRNGASPSIKSTSALTMDDLTYNYKTAVNGATVNSNQLYEVGDAQTSSAYTDDIKGPSSVGAYTVSANNHYTYDEIGNLKSNSDEYIALIKWTVDRKVRRILRDSTAMLTTGTGTNSVFKPDVAYEYNGMRQLVTKIVIPRDQTTKQMKSSTYWQYTYYVYDPSGNVMATYDRSTTGSGPYTDVLKLSENHVYGSSRLAISRPAFPALAQWTYGFTSCGPFCRTITGGTTTNPVVTNTVSSYLSQRNLGFKEFELTNHLGNVITTVSDRKIIVSACPDQFLHTFDDGSTLGINTARSTSSIVANKLQITPTGTNANVNFTYTAHDGDLINISFDLDMSNSTAADSLSATSYPYNSGTHAIGPAYSKIRMSANGTYNLPFTGPPASSDYNNLYVEIATQTPMSLNHQFVLDNLGLAIGNMGSPSVNTCSILTQLPVQLSYFPDLLMHTDYYPFGQQMPARQWVYSDYRYGMNDQEKQDAMFKGANSAEYWMYDSRTGRRWDTDPITYEWESPYATFNNNPILFSDINGAQPGEGEGADMPGEPGDSKNITGPPVRTDGVNTFPQGHTGTPENPLNTIEVEVYATNPGVGDIKDAEQGVSQVYYDVTIVDKNGPYPDGKSFQDQKYGLTSTAGQRIINGTDPNSFVNRYVSYSLQVNGPYTSYFNIQIHDEIQGRITKTEKSDTFKNTLDNFNKSSARKDMVEEKSLISFINIIKSNLKANQKITAAEITLKIEKNNDGSHDNREFKQIVASFLNKELGSGFKVNFISHPGGDTMKEDKSVQSTISIIFDISTIEQ